MRRPRAGAKRILAGLSVTVVTLGLILGLLEVSLRIFAPLQYIVPASDWTAEYGPIAYPNAKIVNAQPGVFRNVYTTNPLRYRGKLVPFDDDRPKVVLLGDSNIFGFGLNDDETIDSRLNDLYGGEKVVINLANGGWSLGQEVRRYLELGERYAPEIVVLHIAGNDLHDIKYGVHWVAFEVDGRIEIRGVEVPPMGRLRTLLPPDGVVYSLLIRSQIVARLKGAMYLALGGAATDGDHTTGPAPDVGSDAGDLSGLSVVFGHQRENERRYIALLNAFAQRLAEDRIHFVLLTDTEVVAGEEGVAQDLTDEVRRLAEEGLLEHVAISRWFVPGRDFPHTLQGHGWGPEFTHALAHRLHQVLERLEHHRVRANLEAGQTPQSGP